MQLKPGQVYERDGERVVILEVRDEGHPRGLGEGYGESALALPEHRLTRMHPFDVVILCDASPHHRDWRLVETVRYEYDAGADRFWPMLNISEEAR